MYSLDHEALLHAAHVQNPFCPEEILALHAKQNRQPAGDGIAVKRGVLLVMFVLFFVVSSVELFVEGDAVGAFVVLGVDAEEGLVALPSEAAAVGRERAGVEDPALYRGRVVTGSHPAALAPQHPFLVAVLETAQAPPRVLVAPAEPRQNHAGPVRMAVHLVAPAHGDARADHVIESFTE